MGSAAGVLLAAALILLSGAGSPTHAQDAVELWGARGEWAGENTEDFQGGYALGAAYLADVGFPLDVGLDVVFARFEADQLADRVDEFQFAAVGRRWLLGSGFPVRPYLGARVGYTRLAADLADLKFEQNGAMGGLILGFVVPTRRTLSPFVSAEALRVHYEDTTLFLDGLELPSSGGWGWRFFLKVGVTFGSGWERR